MRETYLILGLTGVDNVLETTLTRDHLPESFGAFLVHSAHDGQRRDWVPTSSNSYEAIRRVCSLYVGIEYCQNHSRDRDCSGIQKLAYFEAPTEQNESIDGSTPYPTYLSVCSLFWLDRNPQYLQCSIVMKDPDPKE